MEGKMGKVRKPADHSNKFTIKVILIAIFFVSAIVGLAIYIYSYPRATIRLYNDEQVLEKTVQKYKGSKLRLQDLPEIYKTGHSFTYWSLDPSGYEEVQNGISLDQDEYDFYGHFERNTYTITYYIQKYTNEVESDITYEPYFVDHVLYADDYVVPTGIDETTGKLTALLSDRVGYTFNGWSTSIEYEDSIANNEEIRVFEGGKTYNYQDSTNLNLYAIWSKDRYAVRLNTGVNYKTYSLAEIEAYHLAENIHYKVYNNNGINLYFAIDKYGDYVISNTIVDDSSREGISSLQVKYLDPFQTVLSGYQDYTLSNNMFTGASEYDFKGWYLSNSFEDEMTTQQALEVNVDPTTRIPYLKDSSGKKIVSAVEVEPIDGIRQFEFHVYSKWVRRHYTVSLMDNKKVLTTDGIKYTVYKYDDTYGKLYNTDINFTPLMNSYLGKDDSGNDVEGATITLQPDYSVKIQQMNMATPFKFVSWLDSANSNEYYKFTQAVETDSESGLPIAYHTEYVGTIYRHETSGDITMSASWSQMYEILYYKKYASNTRYSSGIYAIVGEYVDLHSAEALKELGGTAASIVSVTATQRHAGWIAHSNTSAQSGKQYDTPTLHSDVGHCFYQLTEKDFRKISTNSYFAFYSYIVNIEEEP